MDVPGVGGQQFPMNLMTGSELGMRVRPEGESMAVVEAVTVEASDRVVQMAMGYKTGGPKMKSVIPMKRKLVKRMMYESIKNFVISRFPSVGSSARAPL
ncbi:hypothetical protein Csa_018325 [Cucumis sativus]|uniref:Uncharacterized protein n=1 Tax=Cucumis sativus TaxID=3659 RepID=A0A0A0KH01_CUCSA|nr:hypothetical protein Csa_018325 [Cucumis sativus]